MESQFENLHFMIDVDKNFQSQSTLRTLDQEAPQKVPDPVDVWYGLPDCKLLISCFSPEWH